MGLFDMTDGKLVPISATSFAAEGVLERTHLQAAVRDNIELFGDDLLVVAEEFGEFEDVNRRIDLLCVDRGARPVVIELKRTADGGHMELQALRYAAMVSAMTLDDVAAIYERHLVKTGQPVESARDRLASWFEDVGGEDAVVRRDVRLILGSADFGREIMTTALWLNDVFGMDIRCVRMAPYRVGDRLLLHVEQVVPLPEAEDIVVRLRRREAAARAASPTSRDWTQYIVQSPAETTLPLRKRHAVLATVHAVHAAGASCVSMASLLPTRFLGVDGTLAGEQLLDTLRAEHPKVRRNEHRWFLDSPVHDAGRTWVLSNQWGTNAEPVMDSLIALVPDAGISYHPL